MKIAVYQVNLRRDTDRVAFEDYDRLVQLRNTQEINAGIYDKVCEFDTDETSLEDVYRRFNAGLPGDFQGRSISVSDIIEVADSDFIEPGFYYCDSVGFRKVDFDPGRTSAMKNGRITVLVVEPGKTPYAKEIDSGLGSVQHEVGGNIELLYPTETDPAAYVMNDEGKIAGLPLNRGLFGQDGVLCDIIAGTFLVVGLDGDRFGSLSDELIRKYTELFRYPETFFWINGQIQCIRDTEDYR